MSMKHEADDGNQAWDTDDCCPPPAEFADPLPSPGSGGHQPPPTPQRPHRGSVSTFFTTAGTPPQPPLQAPPLDKRFFDEYFCDITRNEALKALNDIQMEGAYIVRPGSGSPYCISFLHGGDINHVKIQRNSDGQFALGDTKVDLFFNSMSQLMDHLTKNVIQGVNGIVFRLLINAKPRTKPNRSQLPSSTTSYPRLPSTGQQFSMGPTAGPPPTSPLSPPENSGGVDEFSIVGGGISGVRRSSVAVCQPTSIAPMEHASQLRIRPLSQQRYYADVRRDEAEALLMDKRQEGQFLVRPSKASAYCLSVFHRGRVVHLKIVCIENKFVLEQLISDGQKYTSVPDLIDSLTLSRRTLTLMNGDSIVLMP